MWTRVAKDTIKALVPFKNSVRRVLRKVRPYGSTPSNDDYAFLQGVQMAAKLLKKGAPICTVLEIGTGWVPTIPYVFQSLGAKKLILTDIEPLMDEATQAQAKKFVASRLQEIADQTGVSLDVLQANINRPLDFDYHCPFDFQNIPQGSVDLIYSRTVLEHISPTDLKVMLDQVYRALSEGGFTCHIIDNSDHYEHSDKQLQRINFLRYSSWVWRLTYLNPQAYQNRLRHSDYVSMFSASRLNMISMEGVVDEPTLKTLSIHDLHPDFHSYTPEDIATLTSWIIGRKQ